MSLLKPSPLAEFIDRTIVPCRRDSIRISSGNCQLDTGYVRTYTVSMNITLSIDEQIVERAREKLRAMGKT